MTSDTWPDTNTDSQIKMTDENQDDVHEHDVVVEGKCDQFCPQNEFKLRKRERLVHRLESSQVYVLLLGTSVIHINNPSDHRQDGSFQLVKEYSRPAAGQRSPGPREVRTPETLVRCVRYLVATVMRARLRTHDRQDLYDFLFDRLRAVRQDMVVQGAGVAPRTRLQLLATCARFHLVWGQLLAATPSFSAHLNTQHQLDTLKSCLVLGEGAGLGEDSELEAVQCVYLLSNLDSPHALNWAVQLPHRSRALGNIT